MTSGDKDNLEAAAAAYYFPALFGTGFTRSADDGRNAALNYGYAICAAMPPAAPQFTGFCRGRGCTIAAS